MSPGIAHEQELRRVHCGRGDPKMGRHNDDVRRRAFPEPSVIGVSIDVMQLDASQCISCPPDRFRASPVMPADWSETKKVHA